MKKLSKTLGKVEQAKTPNDINIQNNEQVEEKKESVRYKASKSIITSVLLFTVIIGFVKCFEYFFGKANVLVGVTIIIAILVLFKENLTKKPLENFLTLAGLSLFLGILSYFANFNIYLGAIINFIAMFIVGYLLSYRLDKVLIIPWGLQYLFMLYNPVTGHDFVLRLEGLIAGAVIIMGIQYIIHIRDHKKDKKAKDSNGLEVTRDSILTPTKDEEKLYTNLKIFGKNFPVSLIRIYYAFRIGLATSITAFFIALFNLPNGRWVIYTVFSLTELYSHQCIERSKERITGTIIGTFIILFLFWFIKQPELRALIVLIAGFMDTFVKNYTQKMICVTVAVVASVYMIDGTLVAAVERVYLVFVGILIALLFNKVIFNQKVEQQILDYTNVEKCVKT